MRNHFCWLIRLYVSKVVLQCNLKSTDQKCDCPEAFAGWWSWSDNENEIFLNKCYVLVEASPCNFCNFFLRIWKLSVNHYYRPAIFPRSKIYLSQTGYELEDFFLSLDQIFTIYVKRTSVRLMYD